MLRTSSVCSLALALVLGAPLGALAQAPPADRVSFGSGVHVGPGETVRDAVSFGGDTIVEGEVTGDATAFGGSVILRGGGRVQGDVTSFGGEVRDEAQGGGIVIAPGSIELPHAAPARGPLDRFRTFMAELGRSAVAHALLFLLGLVLLGTARERVRAMQVTIIRDGLETTGTGLLAYIAAIASIVLFAITLIGIPIAFLVGLALPVATYVGLAVTATVIGAALPIEKLRGREVAQLAAGVGVLFVASMVPWVGALATAVAACLGLGALVRTRFGTSPAPVPEGPGPYRTAAA